MTFIGVLICMEPCVGDGWTTILSFVSPPSINWQNDQNG